MNEGGVRIVGNLGGLPGSASGPTHMVWWGNFGFMLIEGMAFLLAAGCYVYLIGRPPSWPPPGDAPPDLTWGVIFTAALVLSEVPNLALLRMAEAKRAAPVRWLALLMSVIGIALLVLRGFEFAHLNVSWDHDAYGSVLWMLMVLHTTHLLTELGETGVQTLWLFTHQIGDDQFADVEDDSNYWTFVVLAWLPLYGIVYWLPRLL
jgi:cytochrome c oxidase subunit 3